MNAIEIREARKKLSITQYEFANLLHVSPRAVQSWESGSRNITHSTAELIKNLLKNHEQDSHMSKSDFSNESVTSLGSSKKFDAEEIQLQIARLLDSLNNEELRNSLREIILKIMNENERLQNKIDVLKDILR